MDMLYPGDTGSRVGWGWACGDRLIWEEERLSDRLVARLGEDRGFIVLDTQYGDRKFIC